MITDITVCVLILFALLVACVRSDGKHLICKEVDDVFARSQSTSGGNQTKILQGRSGKRGLRGVKGEIGEVGPPGPPVVVNYSLIEDTVTRALSSDYQMLSGKMRAFERKMDELSEDLWWNKPLTTEYCDVFYMGRCFRHIRDNNINFDAGKILCERIGWKLANIYDTIHYEMIASYLREQIPPSQSYVTACLGMTINPTTIAMFYSNGAKIHGSGMRWYPGHPSSSSSYTKIGIHINGNKENSVEGIHSYPPSGTRLGSVCEK